jgi:hypothetical protein
MRFLLFGLALVAVALPAMAASAYRSINWLIVIPVSADTFEVIDERGESARAIWCAAADYVRAAGLDGVRKRIYVVEPRGPSKTRANAVGVMFTINPDEEMAKTPSSYSVSVKRKGENLGVGHAYNFCESVLEERFERF